MRHVVVVLLLASAVTACSPVVSKPACNSTNCTGCCDSAGACQAGLTTQTCGSNGATCSQCAVNELCSFGRCMAMQFNQGGGSVTGGGSAGGSIDDGGLGGGAAGGNTAGGSAGGGSTAGGSAAGGNAAGGSGGGSAGGSVDAGQPNPCAGSLQACGTRCLDLQSDPENCGTCGRTCGQGEVCNRGTCGLLPMDCTATGMGCGSGYYCDPVTRHCLTGCRLSSDCPMGATCSSGTCSCPTNQHACGQQCVADDSTSSCGSRCSVCPQPANSTATCTTGACGFTCASGFREQNGQCVDIDECATANGGCSANAACANTPGSRTCTCNQGFTGDGVTCTDVNECLANNGGCDSNAACTNTPGSRTCMCLTGYTGNGTTCADVDECLTGNGGCSAQATCTNIPGSRSCACNAGYTGTGFTCTDINECATNNGGCDANAACANTPGSRTCACNMGFSGNGTTCTDVNECLVSNGGCDGNATCTNTTGSRTCACNMGFTGSGTSCTDVNECLTNNGGCAAVASGGVCTNTPGSRTCACTTGYTGNGTTCSDINECATNNGGCDANATCTNSPGSRSCACNTGYSGSGTTCTDVNECLTNNGGCAAVASGGVCTNTPGSRTCACATGYTGNGTTCADVNECLTANGGCDTNATCTNTAGSRTCACNSGFTGNGTTCADVNECSTNNGGCSSFATCTNTPGSRTCLCNAGYAGNGLTCTPNGDTCSAPIDLTLGVTVNGTTLGAVNDYAGPLSAVCRGSSLPGADVVYRFTPATTGAYKVSPTASGWSPRVWVGPTCGVTSSCVTADPAWSSSSVLNFVFRGTAGVPAFIHVDDDTTIASPFTLQVTSVTTPTNDTCASATPLPLGTPTAGSIVNAIHDDAPCSMFDDGGGEVVFSFTPSVTGRYSFSETTTANVDLWVKTACGAATCVAEASQPETVEATLTAGTTYFLFVRYNYPNDTAAISVTVTQVTTPSNDTCAAPIDLTLGVTVNGTTQGAANDYAGPLSAVCRGSSLPGADVVYRFTPATTGAYKVSPTSSGWSPRVWVGPSCGVTSSCVTSDPAWSSSSVLNFVFRGTAGVPAFIHVDDDTTIASPFTLQVTSATPPANDTCATATPLTLGTPASGTVVDAIHDDAPCSMFDDGGGEVVFSFTPSVTGRYSFSETTTANVDLWVKTACGAATCVAEASQPETVEATLTAGTTYFLFVRYNYPNDTAAISVTVTQVTTPTNDTCAAPIDLTLGVTVNGTTQGAANDYAGPLSAVCRGSSLPGADVVYRFTPATTGAYKVSPTSSGWSPRVWVGPTCGVTSSCVTSDPAWSSSSVLNFVFRGTVGTPAFIHVDDDTTIASPFTLQVTSATPPANDTCATATALTLGTPTAGTIVDAIHDDAPCAMFDDGGGEVVFRFTPGVTGQYSFSETTTTNVDLWVKTACGAATCVAEASQPETASATLTAGTTYYLFVRYNYPNDTGAISITVSSP